MKRVCIPYRNEQKVRPYMAAAEAAGLKALALSVAEPATLRGAEGLLLTGGTDVNPALYGQVPRPEVDQPDDERDRAELRLIDEALERDIPILAICRGLQLLNVHRGGTLLQHLASKRHDTEFQDKSTVAHEVQLEPASHLSQILEQMRVAVNSRHHQAADRIGEGLRVSARDTDSSEIIEGLELPTRRFVIAVQWHPEDQAPGSPVQRRLFERFARACGANPLSFTNPDAVTTSV